MIWFEYELEKGKGYSQSAAEKQAQEAQQRELEDLQAKEQAKKSAMNRARRGRASLISGSETGSNLSDTLGG